MCVCVLYSLCAFVLKNGCNTLVCVKYNCTTANELPPPGGMPVIRSDVLKSADLFLLLFMCASKLLVHIFGASLTEVGD